MYFSFGDGEHRSPATFAVWVVWSVVDCFCISTAFRFVVSPAMKFELLKPNKNIEKRHPMVLDPGSALMGLLGNRKESKYLV